MIYSRKNNLCRTQIILAIKERIEKPIYIPVKDLSLPKDITKKVERPVIHWKNRFFSTYNSELVSRTCSKIPQIYKKN